MQQPRGTSMYVLVATLLNSPIAAGVEIMLVPGIGSPLIAIASEIGPTVPPVATAIFPLKDI
jgi:hypothetical protein